MKATISYGQLLDLLLKAETQAKREYENFGFKEDLHTANLAFELRQAMLNTEAWYFELKDSDPFERPFEIKWEIDYGESQIEESE